MPDDQPEPPAPLDLDAVERTGAVRFGRSVIRLVMVHEDGREVSIDLPTPAHAGLNGLTPTQRRIVQVLNESPGPMTRKQVAGRLGRADTTGKLGADVRALLAAGILYESAGELTDDPSKFRSSNE